MNTELYIIAALGLPVYAALDHHVGGARLFRGEANAKASEDFHQNDGTVGYLTWYWDKRFVPYILFSLYTAIYAYAAGHLILAPALILTYFWLRSISPVTMFPAANGATAGSRWKAIGAGALIGIGGLSPGFLGAYFNPWLALTPLLGIGFGLYHWFFRSTPLFRSYAELCQGATVWLFITIHLLGGKLWQLFI